jgi:excisionase family DNA binding protein
MAEMFLSLQDVADELGISVQTIRKWVKGGELAAYKPGKEYRIKPSDLEEFLKTREVDPKASASPSDSDEQRRRDKATEARRIAEEINVPANLDSGNIVDVMRDVEDAHPKAAAAPVSLSQWFEARCGHSFLALSKDELQERFDALAEDGPERRELGLKINNEFNEFCAFPRNVTTQERLSMRKMIRDSISAVAVKHQLALFESGLYPEYAEELSRVFDLERTLDADEASA